MQIYKEFLSVVWTNGSLHESAAKKILIFFAYFCLFVKKQILKNWTYCVIKMHENLENKYTNNSLQTTLSYEYFGAIIVN